MSQSQKYPSYIYWAVLTLTLSIQWCWGSIIYLRFISNLRGNPQALMVYYMSTSSAGWEVVCTRLKQTKIKNTYRMNHLFFRNAREREFCFFPKGDVFFWCRYRLLFWFPEVDVYICQAGWGLRVMKRWDWKFGTRLRHQCPYVRVRRKKKFVDSTRGCLV